MVNTDDIRKTGPVGLKGLSAEQRARIKQAQEEANRAYLNRYNTPVVDTSEIQRYSPDEAMASWGTSQYDNPGENQYLTKGEMQDTRYENQPWYDTLANGVGKMLGTMGTTFVSSLIGLPMGLETAARERRWSGLWDNEMTQVLGDADDWLEKNMTNYKSQEQEESPWYSPVNLFSMNKLADDVIKNFGFTLGAAASMAVGSGALGLLSKAFKSVNEISKGTKIAANIASSLFSATGEGMIEARQGVEERNKREIQRLEDELAPEKEALDMELAQINEEYAATKGLSYGVGPDGRPVDLAYEKYKQRMAENADKRSYLNQKLDAGMQEIEETGKLMGNKILLGNQVLLSAGNFIQFGKLMTNSFNNARHMAKTTSKTVKPTLVNATRKGPKLSDGYEIKNKNLGKLYAGSRNLITEGSEEMNQQWIQNSAGYMYNAGEGEAVNDYWKNRLNKDASKETANGLYDLGNIISRGFKDSWGDFDQWEQFFIGALTGMAGSYAPTKLFNQDKTKSVFNPMRYGSWEGGTIQGIKDFNKEYGKYEENINDLNTVLAREDFPDRLRSLIAHTALENEKEYAALNDDKKLWKDADDKQAIHDIQAFIRAGKVDDLRAIYDEMSKDLKDEDIDEILKRTTKEISAEEDKQKHDAAIDQEIAQKKTNIEDLSREMAAVEPDSERALELREDIAKENMAIEELEASKAQYQGKGSIEGAFIRDGVRTLSNDEIRQKIKNTASEMQRKLDSYLDSIDYIDKRSGGNLTKDQEDNLAYIFNVGKEKLYRSEDIVENKVRSKIPSKFFFKTNKTPEQLANETTSSDLAFSKNENTPEGYVEVDASLLNKKAYTDFLIREVLNGGNISPEFGETADEKALREREEAEEKNLSKEEREKRERARAERYTKKFEEALNRKREAAEDQRKTNIEFMADNFVENYKKTTGASQAEALMALSEFWNDLGDAIALRREAGEYDALLDEYMRDPSKIDEDKKKEETKAEKEKKKDDIKENFGGKSAKDIHQAVREGEIDLDDIDDIIDFEADEDDEETRETQEEAKKAKKTLEKENDIKQSIIDAAAEQDIDNSVVEEVLNAVGDVAYNAETDEDLSLDVVEDYLSERLGNSSDDDTEIDDDILDTAFELASEAFNKYQESIDKMNDVPDEMPDDVEGAPETGHDSGSTVPSSTATPDVKPGKKNEYDDVLPQNELTKEALDKVVKELHELYSKPSDSGIWRTCTTRYRYHSTYEKYHESLEDKNSVKYKRSKVIYEYLDNQGAYDRVETPGYVKDVSARNDVTIIHFMVKNFSKEIFGKEYDGLTEDEKSKSLVILMLNEKGEVLGDLPLAEFEKSQDSQQVKELRSFENLVFDAFKKKREEDGTCNEALVDNSPEISKEGLFKLNLTFAGTNRPLVSRVTQMMNGLLPFRKNERNTLNDVVGNNNIKIGIAVTGNRIVSAKRKEHDLVKGKVANVQTGSIGQSYLLIPSANGKYIPAPFYTKPYDAQKHKDTELSKLLFSALSELSKRADNQAGNSEIFKKNMDIIEALLQVKSQDGAKKVIEVTKNKVSLHLQSLTNPDQKIDVTVPNSDNKAEVITQLMEGLSGIPINVSLMYINRNITKDLKYNRVIGEIADINLPKNTAHTINNWFTIALYSGGKLKATTTKYRQSGTFMTVLDGRQVKIDVDHWVAYEPSAGGDMLIVGDEKVNLFLAEVKASMQQDKTKPFKIDIDGETRTYDPVERDFVKTSVGSGMNAGEQSLSAQQKERREAAAEERKNGKKDTPYMERVLNYLNKNPEGTLTDLQTAIRATDKFFKKILEQLKSENGLSVMGDRYSMTGNFTKEETSQRQQPAPKSENSFMTRVYNYLTENPSGNLDTLQKAIKATNNFFQKILTELKNNGLTVNGDEYSMSSDNIQKGKQQQTTSKPSAGVGDTFMSKVLSYLAEHPNGYLTDLKNSIKATNKFFQKILTQLKEEQGLVINGDQYIMPEGWVPNNNAGKKIINQNFIKNNLLEIPFETLSWNVETQKQSVSSGKARIIDYADRKIIVLNVNGFKMPFYLSSGHGGKKDVKAGKWYPFFGVGSDGWLNKLGEDDINNYYGSDLLRSICEELDNYFGDIRSDSSIQKVKATGSHIDFINSDLNPAENEKETTLEDAKLNVKNTIEELNKRMSISSEQSEEKQLEDINDDIDDDIDNSDDDGVDPDMDIDEFLEGDDLGSEEDDNPVVEQEEPVINTEEREITVTATSKAGNAATGKYTVSTDADGFTHIKHEGSSMTQRGMDLNEMFDNNIIIDDIIGKREDFNDPNIYDEEVSNFEHFKVDKITIRPNGDVSIEIKTDSYDTYQIEGDTAKKIVNILFPELSEGTERDTFEEMTLSLSEVGKKILSEKKLVQRDRHSNGHVRGGQSGWKIRFIVKNPNTGNAFTQDEVNADKDAYFKAANPLLEFLKEYFKNPDGTDTIEMHKPQSDGYSAHYIYTDKEGNKREPFKFLSGGEVGEADFTIYIGSKDDVDKFISDIKGSPIYELLAEGNNNGTDTTFNEKIHGRIEGRSIGFSGYQLPDGLEKMVPRFSTVYEDDKITISIVVDPDTEEPEYMITDKETDLSYGYSPIGVDSESTPVGYVKKKITHIRTKIAENLYGEYITGTGETQIETETENPKGSFGIDEVNRKVEEEYNIVNDSNREAWNRISDDLKLQLFNDGISVTIQIGNKKKTVGLLQLGDILTEVQKVGKRARVTIEAAAKPMMKEGITIAREKEREMRKWLSRNLPMLNSDERVAFVERLSRAGNDASKMWGTYKNGVIEIMKNAPEGTTYHEAFHYVMDMLLTDEQRKQILDIARKEYGEMNNAALEERLANDFRRYALDENAKGIAGKIKRWIRKLMDTIKRYNRISDATINQLFWKINNGEFASRGIVEESFEENQQRVLKEIREVYEDKHRWDKLDADTRKGFNNRGISKEIYENLSTKEREQYKRCL